MVEYPKHQEIAIVSGFLTILAFSHLVYNVYTTKKTEQLTYLWIFLVLTAQSLLVLYGTLNNAYGIYLPAFIICLGLIYVVYVKLSYDINNKIEHELKSKNIII